MSDFGTSLATVAEPRPAATGTVPGWIVFVQSVLGGSGLLAVHVPLGVLLFGSAVAMLGWAWSPGIRVRRSRARVSAG